MSSSDIKIIPPKEPRVENNEKTKSLTTTIKSECESFLKTDKECSEETIKKETIKKDMEKLDLKNVTPKDNEPLTVKEKEMVISESKVDEIQNEKQVENNKNVNPDLHKSLSITSKTEVQHTNALTPQCSNDNSGIFEKHNQKYSTLQEFINTIDAENLDESKVTQIMHETTQNKLEFIDLNNIVLEEPIEELNNEILLAPDALSTKLNTIQTPSIKTNINTIENVDKPVESSSTGSEILVNDIGKLNISDNNNKNVSSVVLNIQTDSFKNLMAYDSSDNDSDDSDFEKNWQLHMLNSNQGVGSSEDSESDSNESVGSSDASSTVEIGDIIVKPKKTNTSNENSERIKAPSALYSLEELDKFNLPPLPDLNNLQIDYEHEEFLHIGHVKAIVESLVTIEAIQGSPSYDLDTILFIDDQTSKKPLGAIFDVIGPVVAPIYCIRLKDEGELQERGVKLNMKVYSAPKSKYTQYVFVAELRKIKGTDASWRDDQELPHGLEDSSGEESQCEIDPLPLKRKRNSLEKHQRFEKTMNRCNSLHTKVAKLMDHHRVTRRGMPHKQCPIITNVARAPEAIPVFDPSIPPPNFADLNAFPPPPFGAGPPTFGAGPPTFGAGPPTFGAGPPTFGAGPPTFGAGPPTFGAGPPTAQYQPQLGAVHHHRPPQLWQQVDFQQPRFLRQHFPRQNQSYTSNHHWTHHPGPSRGHGFH